MLVFVQHVLFFTMVIHFCFFWVHLKSSFCGCVEKKLIFFYCLWIGQSLLVDQALLLLADLTDGHNRIIVVNPSIFLFLFWTNEPSWMCITIFVGREQAQTRGWSFLIDLEFNFAPANWTSFTVQHWLLLQHFVGTWLFQIVLRHAHVDGDFPEKQFVVNKKNSNVEKSDQLLLCC